MSFWTILTYLLVVAPFVYFILKLQSEHASEISELNNEHTAAIARHYGANTKLELAMERCSEELARLKLEYGPIAVAQQKLLRAQHELEDVRKELKRLNKEVVPLLGEELLLDSGFYRISYSFPDSDGYRTALEAVREQQKEMVKGSAAVQFDTAWTIDNNEKAGKKFAKDISAMMLRAFNGEADATVARVSYKNYGTSLARIQKAYEQLNKLGKTLNCEISFQYRTLKEKELKLAFEYVEMKYEEAEEQRAIKERMREEERAERELRKAVEDAEDEECRWNKALKLAKDKLAAATGAAHAELALQVASLQAQLATALTVKQRAVSMAQKTRAGYVYVISNIGSFGEDIYKVGLTRRLDPLDRVRELSDASVPFAFDVHAVIYSDDAPSLETALHRELAKYQVNKVNYRKEFFRVELNTIEKAVNKHHGRFSLTRVAEAKQYRESLALGSSSANMASSFSSDRLDSFTPTSFARTNKKSQLASAGPKALV